MRLAWAVLVALLAAAGLALPSGGEPGAASVRYLPSSGRAVERAIPTAWCGGAEAVGTDRKPDATAGPQVHVVYAIPVDGADRFAALASAIVSDAAAIDEWWRKQDPARTPRLDLFAFPGCTTTFGSLDLSRVQFPQPASFFAPVSGRLTRIADALKAAGLDDAFKKYVVLYDGPVEQGAICGSSFLAPRDGGAGAVNAIYLASTVCPFDLGNGGFTASTIAHELMHNLGAVDRSAPNVCPGGGHVCDDPNDMMYPESRGQGIDELTLDPGRDDYYAHAGAWWDVQDSGWLSRLETPDFPVSVTVEGSGKVVSDQPGIDCPAVCSIVWDGGSVVGLRAEATGSARFRGWSGSCSGLGDCSLTIDGAKTVTARFAAPLRLSVRLVRRLGSTGVVTSRPLGIVCPSSCGAAFDEGTRVQLRAKPGARSRFVGWGGACRGAKACTVTLATAASVTATFTRR